MREGAAALTVVVAVALGACATTTVDAPATSTAPDASSGTGPVGALEPLDALALESGSLSEALAEGDGQTEVLARIEALWGGLRPEIAESRPELLDRFDAVVALLRRSVERRRPGDADKAHRNLLALIAAYRDG